MNAIVFEERDGEGDRRLWLARKIYHPEDYFLSLTNIKEKGDYHFPRLLLNLSHFLNISPEKNVISLQYSGEFIAYNDN